MGVLSARLPDEEIKEWNKIMKKRKTNTNKEFKKHVRRVIKRGE